MTVLVYNSQRFFGVDGKILFHQIFITDSERVQAN